MVHEPVWKDDPDDKDYPAALSYLSLLLLPSEAVEVVDALAKSETVTFKAKDIIRASQLRLLPADNAHVARGLEKIKAGKELSPVLLVRPTVLGCPTVIADGYHRCCAVYHADEDADVRCRIV